MTKNVGGIDRILRIVAGLTLVVLAFTGVLGAWAWLGLIVMATGLVGICMPYKLFGFNTCAIKTETGTSNQ